MSGISTTQRMNLRLAIRAVANDWDIPPVAYQSIIHEWMKYLAWFATKKPDELTLNDRRLHAQVATQLVRIGDQRLKALGMELSAEVHGLFEQVTAGGDTVDAVAVTNISKEQMYVEQIRACETKEELAVVRRLIDRSRAADTN